VATRRRSSIGTFFLRGLTGSRLSGAAVAGDEAAFDRGIVSFN